MEKAKDLPVPSKKSSGAAGLDICSCERKFLKPKSITVVETGMVSEFAPDYELQVRSRSGLAIQGICVYNAPGTIDSDYRGEIKIILYNSRDDNHIIERGDRIAQLVFCPTVHPIAIRSLPYQEGLEKQTERGAGGFGSTGKS